MKILVADDDIILTESLREWLAARGYEVATAGTGRLALERLKRGVDVLILDMRMPMGDGTFVLHCLAGLKRRPKIIVLTADVRADVEGADAVLVKPVDFDMIERTLVRLGAPPPPTSS